MTQMTVTKTRADKIEEKSDRALANGIGITTGHGMAVRSMGEAFEVARMMSLSCIAVPNHLRENPGACLAVAIQAYEWSINPFALANKSYSVNDRLSYEAAIYNTVLQRRAPIKGRLKIEYFGKGLTRTCRVWAILQEDDTTVDYTSPEIEKIKPQNSPLWKTDPDQQLFFYSVRAFARRHFADVMLGVYTVDEMHDSLEVPSVAKRASNSSFDDRLSGKPAQIPGPSEGQTIDTTTGQLSDEEAEKVLADAAARAETPLPGDAPSEYQADEGDVIDNRQIVPDGAGEEWLMELAVNCAPQTLNPDQAVAVVRSILKTKYTKPWAKLAIEQRQQLADRVASGELWA